MANETVTAATVEDLRDEVRSLLGHAGLGELAGFGDQLLDSVDPVSIGRSYGRALTRAARRPWAAVPALARFAGGMAMVATNVGTRVAGIELPGVVEPDPRDFRFQDPTWRDNLVFHGLLQTYLVTARLVVEMAEAAGLDEPEASKAEFAAEVVADAIAPTNFLPTNPRALKRAFETAGRSAARGFRNMVHDVLRNDGWPSQVDRRHFELGTNMAATPGEVVYRNELIELLQYAPQTESVHRIPLLVMPPWINRYYIADLAPGKSLVEWAVQHGHTTFAISYRNPDERARDVTFDDYLRLGPLAAIDVVREITGSETVNTLGICLGGTMNTMVLAYLNACGDHLVNSTTLINSANDYGNAGDLATVFGDPQTLTALVRRMENVGYLPGKDMARTFDLLRANDLVFRYVIDGWLLGEDPPSFDLLAWNADCTNMPGRAHADFVRAMYVENALARDQFVALGERLLVSEIGTDTYIVAAVEDHIVPWRVSYRTTQLLKGPVRFVLTSGGHIAGIVNPPGPRAKLWTNDDLPPDPDEWRAGATETQTTWWNDWAWWLGSRAGDMVAPPPIGSASHPSLGPAPGTYVRG